MRPSHRPNQQWSPCQLEDWRLDLENEVTRWLRPASRLTLFLHMSSQHLQGLHIESPFINSSGLIYIYMVEPVRCKKIFGWPLSVSSVLFWNAGDELLYFQSRNIGHASVWQTYLRQVITKVCTEVLSDAHIMICSCRKREDVAAYATNRNILPAFQDSNAKNKLMTIRDAFIRSHGFDPSFCTLAHLGPL